MDILTIVGLVVAVIAIILATRIFSSPKSPTKTEKEQEIPQKTTEKKQEAKETCESCDCGQGGCQTETTPEDLKYRKLKILFGTQTGTCEEWAQKLSQDAQKRGLKTEVVNLSAYDPDDLTNESLLVFIVSTYTGGTPPESCTGFFNYLDDQTLDFREDKNKYKSLHYAVFGIGNSIYGQDFNAAAKNIDRMFLRLAGRRLVPVGLGDNGAGVEVSTTYSKWTPKLWAAVEKLASKHDENKRQRAPPVNMKMSEEYEDSEEDPDEPLADVEDLGGPMKKPKKKKKAVVVVDDEESEEEDEEDDESMTSSGEPREMLTPSLRKALTKQGYKLLGSHSGVKLCRWTKAMLRGRGGCYKHTFYGITSFQCMEMTPSLACANKCVFCWRHHKNPVGKEWRWKMDGPEELIDLATQNHYNMIKQLRGVPGVVPERFEEAAKIRHCALSLVGEPIIYPHINRFLDLLHERNISSFLVTNAQFPDKIDALSPVTQLYISVDAATKESLKRIDRPLFADFWERFLSCIESLSKKGQRTVFRMTLVKEWNMEEMLNYAQLIERGRPSFIEIKGVTYCGTSKASSLTMKNVPFHEEVRNFSRALCEATPFLRENYDLSCEHEHSCCILISDKRFKTDAGWNTWIDYTKFHELVKSGQPFNAFDYMAPTPSWAVVGAPEKGFDPEETRFRRKTPYQKGGC